VTELHVHDWPAWHRHCPGCGVTEDQPAPKDAAGLPRHDSAGYRVSLWSCPECGFTFDTLHVDVVELGGGYSCPACAELRLSAEVAVLRAQRDAALPRIGSALVVRDGEGRVLLGRRAKDPNRGRWVLPGGKIELFESIAEAGRREICEETGLNVDVGEQIGAFEIIRPPHEHRLIVYSLARPIGGQLRAASDVSELRFCSADEIAELDLTEICADVLRAALGVQPEPSGE
jgi:8-oxo-dGTP diphosphatase